MNVLLTSVGRRSYLVRYFRDALAGRGKVVGGNLFADAPGMYIAHEAEVLPSVGHPDYVDAVLGLCRKHDIRLLCSLHDLDVLVLSQYRESFERQGITTTLPSRDWGRIALDKRECGLVLEQAGFPVVQSFLSIDMALAAIHSGELRFPVVVKGRLGYGSMGLRVCQSEADLRDAHSRAVDQISASPVSLFSPIAADAGVVIQPFIQGREVCMAVCNDLEGVYRAHFTCEVHAMRAGESDSATSIERGPFEAMARRFSEFTRHSGIWGVDLLQDDGVYRVIDINPRFSGDYPFHHLAGCDIPAALVHWASGAEPPPRCFRHVSGVRGYKDLVPMVAGE